MQKQSKWIWCAHNSTTEYNQTAIFQKAFEVKQIAGQGCKLRLIVGIASQSMGSGFTTAPHAPIPSITNLTSTTSLPFSSRVRIPSR